MSRRSYETDRIRVYWDSSKCIHTARCINALPQVFDPEELHDLMLRLRALADGIARRYDGRLGSVMGGPRVLIYFGYPQAHEDNAWRAVRAARELVDQVARMSAGSESERPVVLALRACR